MRYEYITKIEIKFDKKKTFNRKSIKYLQNFIFQESVKLPGRFSIHHSHKLTATIQVIEFLLQTVSKNRVKDMQQDIKEALDRAISKNPKLKSTIIATTGISL